MMLPLIRRKSIAQMQRCPGRFTPDCGSTHSIYTSISGHKRQFANKNRQNAQPSIAGQRIQLEIKSSNSKLTPWNTPVDPVMPQVYESGKTCYICYIVNSEHVTVLHSMLHDVTRVTLTLTTIRYAKRTVFQSATPFIHPSIP
jgi:hypothetical protein